MGKRALECSIFSRRSPGTLDGGKDHPLKFANQEGELVKPTQHGTLLNAANAQGPGMESDRLKLVGSKSSHDPIHTGFFEKKARHERLAEIGTLAAVFAHEVANPLSGLSASLQFALNDLARFTLHNSASDFEIPVVQKTLQGALREVDRLVELLDGFRSVVPAQILNLKFIELETIVQEILALESRGYGAAGITVKLDFEAGLPAIEMDAAKIKQAILNLCKNAVEAMSQGGCLTIRAYRVPSMVVLEIGDDGSGVPDDIDAFELFKTTKPRGTGLGLSVVQQVVSAHHGTITYTSDLEHGTKFTIRLPTSTKRGEFAL
jgi:signal transduction histidine kinase